VSGVVLRRNADESRGATVPRLLRAPDPGWSTAADVVVVGSGIAGLTAALRARAALAADGCRVLLVTKEPHLPGLG
jgi:L-aspartate oxidase